MKVINTGGEFKLYSDRMEVHNKLPAGYYSVAFHQMNGFSLFERSDIEVSESKIYGIHLSKVEKVLNSFKTFQRNLGVILSGDKGIGKSLFTKLLCQVAVKNDYPVIIVDHFIPGISSYIESIAQEIVVVFDEFDKTFKNDRDDSNAQTAMLSLFDGMSSGKKMFVITCNGYSSLNEYLINRPGRFHYHFRFQYPSIDEIRTYLTDKLNKEYYGEIDKVIKFSTKIKLNYDCLRAIVFELNSGENFSSAISDLNITNTEKQVYTINLYMENGLVYNTRASIDMFDTDIETISMRDEKRRGMYIDFDLQSAVYDYKELCYKISKDDLAVRPEYEYEDEDGEQTIVYKPDYLTIEKVVEKTIHYVV